MKGFTLIETVVATLLISATLTTTASLMTTTFRFSDWNINRDLAVALGRFEIESLRALPYDDLASRASTEAWRGISYTIETTVVEDDPDPNMKSIAVVVSWNERGRTSRYDLRNIFIDFR